MTMMSTAFESAAAPPDSTATLPSTIAEQFVSENQPEMTYESAYEMPPEEQNERANNNNNNNAIQTPHSFTHHEQESHSIITPFQETMVNGMTVTPPQEEEEIVPPPPSMCQICGQGDSTTKRLCVFAPNDYAQACTVLHVFCGKTAGILPHVNRPDLEILTKSGIKKKLGSSVQVSVAMNRSRSAVVASNKKQTYFLIKEVEAHVHQIVVQHNMSPTIPMQNLPSSYNTITEESSTCPETTNYTNPRPPPERMQEFQKITPCFSPPRKKLKPTKSPYEVLMERLQITSDEIGGVGYSLVRGVSPALSEDDYQEEDEENFNPKLCSQNQMDHVRILIVTSARQGHMEHMARQFSNISSESDLATAVWDTWRMFQSKYRNSKCWKHKLDMILAFTDAIKDYNEWMYTASTEEYAWDQLTLGLARLWKTLLKKSPEELGVDVEFTLAGIMCLLQDFQELVESVETPNKLEFPYLSKGGVANEEE